MLLSKVCASLSLLALLALTVKGRSDGRRVCPDDPCQEAECPHFFNADCRTDRHNCTPVFTWRGHDVTNRCFVPNCDTRKCGKKEQCMELTSPLLCPEDNPKCRQKIRTRCALTPVVGKLMTCDNVTCGEGVACQMRKRSGDLRPVLQFIPAPPPEPTLEPVLTPAVKPVVRATSRPILEIMESKSYLIPADDKLQQNS